MFTARVALCVPQQAHVWCALCGRCLLRFVWSPVPLQWPLKSAKISLLIWSTCTHAWYIYALLHVTGDTQVASERWHRVGGGSQGFPENENDMTQTSKLTILKDMVPIDLMDMVDIMVGIWWTPWPCQDAFLRANTAVLLDAGNEYIWRQSRRSDAKNFHRWTLLHAMHYIVHRIFFNANSCDLDIEPLIFRFLTYACSSSCFGRGHVSFASPATAPRWTEATSAFPRWSVYSPKWHGLISFIAVVLYSTVAEEPFRPSSWFWMMFTFCVLWWGGWGCYLTSLSAFVSNYCGILIPIKTPALKQFQQLL